MATTKRAQQPDLAADPAGGGAEGPVPLGQIVRLVAAAASLGAAALHASALSQHSFDVLHAAAFTAMAAFQAWWAYLVLRSTAARVLLGGAIGHGAILLLWLVSRTAGIPSWIPGATGREPVGLKDLAAAVLAVAVLAAVDLMSRRDVARRAVRPSHAGAAVGGFVVGAVVLAAVGSFAAGHSHAHVPDGGAGAGPQPVATAHDDGHDH